MSTMTITLTAGDKVLVIGQTIDSPGLFAEDISGWYGTPDSKVDVTERASGDGAHSVPDDAVLYASRVVTVDVAAYGPSRELLIGEVESIGSMTHRIVTISVDDGGKQTSASGYLTSEMDESHGKRLYRGTLTIVCPDPRRYGAERTFSIVPTGDAGGGLLYDDGAGYLLLPIQFAGDAPTGNYATLANDGTSTAYPIITVEGSFPSGVTITHAGGELAYTAPIGPGAPLVLDSLTRTASVLGVDVTRALARRDFPVVAPGGTVTISALADGTGTVTASVRDTYI